MRITRQGLSSYFTYAQWVKRNMFMIERKSINLSRYIAIIKKNHMEILELKNTMSKVKNSLLFLLLLLSHFSRVWLCVIPQMAAHQAPPSLGFSRQEHWSALPFPSPMHESKKWKWSCSVVSDSATPMDYSLPGSSILGIFQARVLEWGAVAFSEKFTE